MNSRRHIAILIGSFPKLTHITDFEPKPTYSHIGLRKKKRNDFIEILLYSSQYEKDKNASRPLYIDSMKQRVYFRNLEWEHGQY